MSAEEQQYETKVAEEVGTKIFFYQNRDQTHKTVLFFDVDVIFSTFFNNNIIK